MHYYLQFSFLVAFIINFLSTSIINYNIRQERKNGNEEKEKWQRHKKISRNNDVGSHSSKKKQKTATTKITNGGGHFVKDADHENKQSLSNEDDSINETNSTISCVPTTTPQFPEVSLVAATSKTIGTSDHPSDDHPASSSLQQYCPDGWRDTLAAIEESKKKSRESGRNALSDIWKHYCITYENNVIT